MTDFDIAKSQDLARKISSRDACDIFIFNGEIARYSDLDFVEQLHCHKHNDTCRLILITNGGDPDAAYKMARYAQGKYKRLEIVLSGLCKSAGTLLAIGAHQLVFSPYGELGPLDIQVHKEDKLSGLHSGLIISEALQALERRALATYLKLIGDIVQSSQGVVSFQTASKAASDVLNSLYAPVFSQIDPEDVGGRTRSMRIAADYGKRLDMLSKNMKPDAVKRLAETYPSHSFVIDRDEAKALFQNTRDADSMELELIEALGELSRWQLARARSEPVILCLSSAATTKGVPNVAVAPTRRRRPGKRNGADSSGTGESPSSPPRRARGRGSRAPRSSSEADL